MNQESTATICFFGDIFLGNGAPQVDPALSEVLRQCDLRIANLEGPLCKAAPIDSRKVLLRSRPGSETALQKLDINFVSLANNHIFDHGLEGLHATQNALDQLGIQYTGAGDHFDQAGKPLVFESNGIRFGLIAATEAKTQARIANSSDYGCNTLDQILITQQIKTLQDQVDHVIVTPHWGYCRFRYPSAQTARLGEVLLDAGASAVVGHHSHVVHGAGSRENGQYIAYSLGNFFFDDYDIIKSRRQTAKGESALGAVLCLRFSKTRCLESRWHFTIQRQQTLALDTNPKRKKSFTKRSAPLQQLDRYERYWRSAVRKRMISRVLFWLNPMRWHQLRPATFSNALIVIKNLFCHKTKGN